MLVPAARLVVDSAKIGRTNCFSRMLVEDGTSMNSAAYLIWMSYTAHRSKNRPHSVADLYNTYYHEKRSTDCIPVQGQSIAMSI